MSEDWDDVPMIPTFPNWVKPYSVKLEYKTSVFEADSGDEQRRALRQRPRKTVSYTVNANKELLRELSLLLSNRRDTRVIVPDPTQSRPFLALDDNTVRVPVVDEWLVPGARVFLIWSSGGREIVTVDSIDADEVTFTATTTVTDSSGGRIAPGYRARFPQQQKLSQLTNMVSQASLMLEVDPGSEEDPDEGEGAFFRDVETMFERPNWRDGVSLTFGVPGDIIDYGVGRVHVEYRQVLNTKIMEFEFVAEGVEEVARHVNLFRRMKGRRGVFYMPSWVSDFQIIGSPDLVNNEITVAGDYRLGTMAYDFSHRNIAFVSRDRVIPCGIVSATPVTDGLKLKLDRDLAALDLPQNFFLSWLLMVRFGSDEITVDWVTSTVAQISYNVAMMRDGFFELAIGGHRMLFGGDYVTIPE